MFVLRGITKNLGKQKEENEEKRRRTTTKREREKATERVKKNKIFIYMWKIKQKNSKLFWE